MLLKNSQKNSKDKTLKSFNEPLRNNDEMTVGSEEEPSSGREEDFYFVIDPYAEKIQMMQDQLKALMHRKDL